MNRRMKITIAALVALLGPFALGWVLSQLMFIISVFDRVTLLFGILFVIVWWRVSLRFAEEPGRVAHILFLGAPVFMFLLNRIPYTTAPALFNMIRQYYFIPSIWVTGRLFNLIPGSFTLHIWMGQLAGVILMNGIYLLALQKQRRDRYR